MASLLRGWHLTTEGQWLLRNLFSQRALQNGCMDDSLKKLFQWKSDITSIKVYAQLVPVLGLEKNKKTRPFFHRIGTVPSIFVNCSLEFLFGQKMELIF